MGSRWAIAFLVATWLAIAGNAVLRSLARSSVRWRDPEFWALQLRLLGGPVLAIAALLGALAAPNAPTRLGIAAAAAAVLAVLGVADHRRKLRTDLRVAIITVAALIVVIAGMRVAVLGSTFLDSLLTIGWIVLVTNAFRRLDHLDGLVAAIGAGAAAGMFGVTATTGNDAVSTVCAALAGACLGALVYNVRPASTVLGPAGASFIGFVLAVAIVEFKPSEATPGGLVLAALLLGLPVLDLLVVTCTRLWRGVPLRTRKPDHLLHRLLRKGWSRDEATVVLVAAQCVMSVLAVLIARGWVSSWFGLLGGAVIAATLVLLGGPEPRVERRGRPRSRVVLLAGVGVFVLLGVFGLVAAAQGVRKVEQAQDALQRALRLGRQGDTEQAELELAEARDHFSTANAWVSSPLGWPGRLVPVVAENLRARARAVRRRAPDLRGRPAARPRRQHEAPGRRRDGAHRRGARGRAEARGRDRAAAARRGTRRRAPPPLPGDTGEGPGRAGGARARPGRRRGRQLGGRGEDRPGRVRRRPAAPVLPRHPEPGRAARHRRDHRQLGDPHRRQRQGHARGHLARRACSTRTSRRPAAARARSTRRPSTWSGTCASPRRRCGRTSTCRPTSRPSAA